MIAAALLMLAAAPETALLDAFKAGCRNIDDLEAAKVDAAAAGWVPIAEEADPRVAKLTALGRRAVGTAGTLSGATYQRTIGGRSVFLILSRYEEDGAWGNGCRLFDFDAPAPIAPKLIDGWMGRIPTGTETVGGATKRAWEPGWSEGITVEANFVPHDSPLVAATALEGNILVAQAYGGGE